MIEDRSYQDEAVINTSSAYQRGSRSVLLVCPTGGGKTVIASKIVRRILSAGKRTLFLAHRRELIKQAKNKLEDNELGCGVIMPGFKPSSAEMIQVGSIQTVIRRSITEPDYIIFDEAHHVTPDNSYGNLRDRYPDARILGLTATPFRLDGRGLSDVFDQYVPTRTPAQLRDLGFLCPISGWVYRTLDTSGVRTVHGDFDQSQLANLDNTILGDVVGEWLKHFRENRVRTILFACGVEHSKQFVAAFRAAGVAAEHIDGETPIAERDAILERVRSGETHILSNCNVATEGFDLPELACCILARPTKSLCMYLQQVGRVMRTAPGKTHAVIHDHANCLMRHGTPYDETREFIPSTTKNKGETLSALRRCPKCGAISDETVCPECGLTQPPRASRMGPTTLVQGVTATSLEDIERELTSLSNVRGMQRFKKWGDTLIGDFIRYERGEGMYGQENRYWFQGLGGTFYIPATVDLHRKLQEASPKPGERCRIQYSGDRERSDFTTKLFKLFIRRDTAL